ncbi:hypothetical protein [Streptomyces sp. XD-27]|uniref:hypothetical protein n=1 Tax=Streptomyces sp. XD-27 TaxID=3062779 RepID=UPI0026F474A7|nr:hypothetical protein [Streptomyces sp. XD-27]WKX73777.1 hypothetical protein Q3Y56_31390 [Streptomyces sp. XD-27]
MAYVPPLGVPPAGPPPSTQGRTAHARARTMDDRVADVPRLPASHRADGRPGSPWARPSGVA